MHAMVKCALRQLSARQPELGQARVLDVGTGNGVLALELLKHGVKEVTGTDYSAASIRLAQAVAQAEGAADVRWLVDDILATQLTPGCAATMLLEWLVWTRSMPAVKSFWRQASGLSHPALLTCW